MHIMREQAQKLERQRLIREMVTAASISRQSQLVSLLRNNGYSVTQTSVSRDLEELGISKFSGVYRLSSTQNRTSYGVLSFHASGDSLIVARCGSGLASALAVQLDSKRLETVVGTIAGDDTVFIAVTDNSAQKELLQKLRKDFDAST